MVEVDEWTVYSEVVLVNTKTDSVSCQWMVQARPCALP